jgi:hypothetical protein
VLNVNQRLTAALLTAAVAALLLTSCSHKDALSEDYGQAWMSQMSSRYAADYGGGGGRLVFSDDNPKRATASVALEQDLEGPYDVLAVCRSTKTVHITIHAFNAIPYGSGETLHMKERLGEAEVDCGATTRIPIDVPKNRDGIALDASTNDRSERALFDTFIVDRGAKA